MADRVLSGARRALAAGWMDGPVAVSGLGEGHINDTLLVVAGEADRYVLQRINRTVFVDPDRVMANLTRVLDHLSARQAKLTAQLLPTRSGDAAWVDDEGGWWRLWRYVPDSRSLSRTADPALCRAAAEAFGRFQRLLEDLPPPPLQPTIARFLELDGYLDGLDAALARSSHADEVVEQACGGARFVDDHRALAVRFPPGPRLIHGDCKLNNVLFAEAAPRVLAVLDLDTVMPGHWAWDFGDLARSVLTGFGERAVAGREATTALGALAEGFQRGSGRPLDPEAAVEAVVHLAFMLGVRFLTDHLQGDRYFRVASSGDNLVRAQAQFDLVRALESSKGLLVAGVAAALDAGEMD